MTDKYLQGEICASFVKPMENQKGAGGEIHKV
jgi:hypothetical protein